MGRSRHEPLQLRGSKPQPKQQKSQQQQASVLSQLAISAKLHPRAETLLGWDIFQVLKIGLRLHCSVMQHYADQMCRATSAA